MTLKLSTEQVWQEMEKQPFAVIGMVTAKNEARTIGIVYIVRNRKLYIASQKETWKVRHIAQNPHVSLTVTIPKRIPLLSWIKIPAATITFSGRATVHDLDEIEDGILNDLMRGMETDPEYRNISCVIEVQPVRDFVTYGVGVPLMAMREPEKARGRAPVA